MIEENDQVPFADPEFALNAEPRCPCILLVDTSTSMRGQPIKELNSGLVTFKDELMADSMASKRVEVAIVAFGPVRTETDFQTADNFRPPVLTASGDTPMGSAIEHALDLLRSRKERYRNNGITIFRPWVFMITDGGPTDSWRNASSLIKDGEQKKSFMFFAVGVEGANLEILRQIAVREPLKLQGLRFKGMFEWLSSSLGTVSRSTPGDDVPLYTPYGWATTG